MENLREIYLPATFDLWVRQGRNHFSNLEELYEFSKFWKVVGLFVKFGENVEFGKFGEFCEFGKFGEFGEFGKFGEFGDFGKFGEVGKFGECIPNLLK